jgi:di/tricarboxylate transporter
LEFLQSLWANAQGLLEPLTSLSPAWKSTGLLVVTLALFASNKVRHDLVAMTALLVGVAMGLVPTGEAFIGLADSAVITVAAVLIIGRAVELSGAAAGMVRLLVPPTLPFTIQISMLLLLGGFLSAWMNNIAALAITMPVMIKLCRDAGRSPAVGLMPLAFTTIIGGMTTLIGTPANLILSGVRERTIGAPFGFFDMTPVGGAVLGVGLIYLVLIGWRFSPRRETGDEAGEEPLRTFELHPPSNIRMSYADFKEGLRGSDVSLLAIYRGHNRVSPSDEDLVQPDDQLVVSSRMDPWDAAKKTKLNYDQPRKPDASTVTAQLVVGDGSPLTGLSYGAIEAQTDGDLRVVAGGPRAARERRPLRSMHVRPGDQLFIQGSAEMLATYSRYARLLELGRKLTAPPPARKAAYVLAIYVISVIAIAAFGVPPALSFVVAAAVMAALQYVPPLEIYRSIDWPVIVLLAAMIPVGQSFSETGAADQAAMWLTDHMRELNLFWALAVMTLATAIFSMFLNNVACAVVMGPVGINVAQALGAPVDAFLLAVLIGSSSDFLTPIGHQNNLLVMGPGGYKFSDYPRLGVVMLIIVIVTTAFVLSRLYG